MTLSCVIAVFLSGPTLVSGAANSRFVSILQSLSGMVKAINEDGDVVNLADG